MLTASCGGGGSGNNFVPADTSGTPAAPSPPQILVPLTRLSTDGFTDPPGQHASEVEPHAFTFGSTIVTIFQVGRIFQGGGVAIGFATSTNGGVTWTSGTLPGLTTSYQNGSFSAASDAAVAFDAAHGFWLASTLTIGTIERVAVSRSRDGLNWDSPILLAATPNSDKNWIVCDNNSASPHFGNCYIEWDDPSQAGLIYLSTSSDGGATWGTAKNTADGGKGIGGQPLVQPDGNVIVPILNQPTQADPTERQLAFRSTDGGATWSGITTIATVADHAQAGNLRSIALPTAMTDAAGNVYVFWQDCRFRPGCTSNDIVMSTSSDGLVWTAPVRVPLDATTSTVDHFLLALGIDPATGGTAAHLALLYYFYPQTSCTATTCSLNIGMVTSQDGGASWSTTTPLVSGISLSSLPNTLSGVMVGDYFATVFSGGKAFPILSVANLPNGSTLDQAIYTATSGQMLAAANRIFTQSERATPNARSDHPRGYYDLDREHPIKPPLRKATRKQ
jgi:hypothetical protein